MADDDLESKLEIIEDSALGEYKSNFLHVGAKVVKEGLYSYFRGFLPNDLQQEETSKTKNNVINLVVNSLLTAGISYGLLYNNIPDAFSTSLSLGFVEIVLDLVARVMYTEIIAAKESQHIIPAFSLSEYLFSLGKYVSRKYQQSKDQLINEQNLKAIAEKKAGTLSLPAPGEQGQLSLDDKTGAVSVSKMNEDYFDSSLF